MGFFNFLRSRAQQNNKPFNLDHIQSIIDLTVPEDDAKKLKVFLEERMKSGSSSNESDEFISQELVDFIAIEPVYFYGFFDWKEDSQEFDYYVRNAVKTNFNVELPNVPICNLDELNSIEQVYKLYGAELMKYSITLCCIDTDSDSYQVVLVKTDDYPKLLEPVRELGYQVKHFTEQW